MILSILIPTLTDRTNMLNRLLEILGEHDDVEILIHNDSELTTGRKRQFLLEQSHGEYVVFIDDDDEVVPGYIGHVLTAIESRPDVVGFKGWMTTNGANPYNFSISKNNPYKLVGNTYLRFNNHLSPIKRDIALQIGYKDLTYGEDYDYACRLRDSGLIKTEVFVNRKLYHYKFVSCKP